MPTNGDNLSWKSMATAEARKRYAERILQEVAQQSGSAGVECERILFFLHRLGASGPGARVLDLGCGPGRWTIELAERGYDIYGIDINSDVIRIARDQAGKRMVSAHFGVALAEFLPFSNDSFDICIVNNILEHVADWKKTLDEVARVTKPGAIAFFDAANALCPFPTEVKYIPFFGYFPRRIKRWITSVIVARFPSLIQYSITPARHWFTPTGLRKALCRAGFKQSWDLIDLITKKEIPPRYRLASTLLPLLKRTPHLYIRDIALLPMTGIRLFCRKD